MHAAFRNLIERNARLWAGEAEVVRCYFASAQRTRESDLCWIARQAFKEMWDGVVPQLASLERGVGAAASLGSLSQLIAVADSACAELRHYQIFVELHESLRRPGDPALEPEKLALEGEWPENQTLRRLRAEHVTAHGAWGLRAQRFTEGGYATLFAEGRRLRGRGGADERIAEACERVYADEIAHMREGVAGLAVEGLDAAGLVLLGKLSTAQLCARIRMRNAQFGRPVAEERIEALCAGVLPPLDWEAAGPSA